MCVPLHKPQAATARQTALIAQYPQPYRHRANREHTAKQEKRPEPQVVEADAVILRLFNLHAYTPFASTLSLYQLMHFSARVVRAKIILCHGIFDMTYLPSHYKRLAGLACSCPA
jgi:hypothetical protein